MSLLFMKVKLFNHKPYKYSNNLLDKEYKNNRKKIQRKNDEFNVLILFD